MRLGHLLSKDIALRANGTLHRYFTLFSFESLVVLDLNIMGP